MKNTDLNCYNLLSIFAYINQEKQLLHKGL